MKKLILMLSAVAFFGTYTVNAQEVAKAKTEIKKEAKKAKKGKKEGAYKAEVQGPGMKFESETIDYGTIPHNGEPNREFVFINNGTEPLIITNTQGSCGCTVPTKPEKAIAPGEKGVIGVHYATDRVGTFTKNVTVTSNAAGMPSKVLTIKGTVLPDPAPATPAPAPAPAAPVKS